jgi:hypothetical protein
VRLRLLAVLSALLLLAALPAGALDQAPSEPSDPQPAEGGGESPIAVGEGEEVKVDPIVVCAGSQPLIGPEGLSEVIETPSLVLGDGQTVLTYRVDLHAPAGTRADVDVRISWGVPTNDYDLAVNGATSLALQPLAPPEEAVSVVVSNCGLLSITVEEFVAPVFVDTITLDVDVRQR